MDNLYGKFNCLTEELHKIFLITSDVKQMQNEWNRGDGTDVLGHS